MTKNDNRTPFERLVRLGWEALDAVRHAEPPSLEKVTQSTRSAFENVRRGLMDETQLKTFHFTAPIDNGTSANVELDLSVGEAGIYTLQDAPNTLLDAHLRYLGSVSFGVSGDLTRMVYLRQSAPLTLEWANPVHWATHPRWDIGLTPQIPLDLRVQGGVGDANVNLAGLQLQSLRVESNIGRMNVTLPAAEASFVADVRAGAGAVGLNIPVRATGTVNVRGGVGGFAVTIAAGAAVQISVAGGVGRTVMTPGFQRTEASAPGLSNTGIWQTPDFDLAERQVRIKFGDAVFGSLTAQVLDA